MAAVISNRADAAGLQFAAARGIATAVVPHKAFASREAFDEALAEAIDAFAPDLVVLAGFMRILGERFVRRYEGRLLNIHPSLLPAFPGLHTHQRAIDAGCKLAGATVHFVTAQLDHGPIVLQSVVPLQARTMPTRWRRACWPPNTASTRWRCAGSSRACCASSRASCTSPRRAAAAGVAAGSARPTGPRIIDRCILPRCSSCAPSCSARC